MNRRLISGLFFLTMLLGAPVLSYAQASASVNYTIVVSEDMLAQDDRGFDYDGRNGSYRFQQNNQSQTASSASSVAVTMHTGFDDENMKTLAAFETEMNTEQVPAIRETLNQKILSDDFEDDMNVNNYYSDNGSYFVVMEYN